MGRAVTVLRSDLSSRSADFAANAEAMRILVADLRAKVADMYVALNSARAYVYQVARACDEGRTTRFDAAGAILLASENAVKVANEAVQALGGAGYTKDWPVERYFRDAKLLDIGAGTNEIRRMLIGRELFAETA